MSDLKQPPATAATVTVTTDSRGGLRIAALWAAEIADAVAAALDARPDLYPCRLLLDRNTGVPLALAAGFAVRGHRVDIDVTWADPRHPPRYALTVDGQPVTVDLGTELRPAVVLAHAASASITGPPRPPATPSPGSQL
jgi:hypothetical protein